MFPVLTPDSSYSMSLAWIAMCPAFGESSLHKQAPQEQGRRHTEYSILRGSEGNYWIRHVGFALLWSASTHQPQDWAET